MKNILYIFAAIALFTSCEDATEIIQPGELGEAQAFRNVDDLEIGVFGVYSSALTRNDILLSAYLTDECAVGLTLGTPSDLHIYAVNPQSPTLSNLWLSYYSLILRANILLQAAENIVPDPMDSDEVNRYNESIAQALALRAFGHSRLLTYFAVDMEDPDSIGVPAIDFVPNPTETFPRNTTGEVLTLINNDLIRAEQLFTDAGTADDVFFFSLSSVRALRARVAAYSGDVTTMQTYANLVLNNFTLPSSPDVSDYNGIWDDTPGSGSQELILKFDITENNTSIGQIFNTNRSDFAGAVNYEMSRVVFDLLEASEDDNGDIRLARYIDPTSLIAPDYSATPDPRIDDVLVVDKYPGDPNLSGFGGALRNDIKVFRTVEMHFILAEAAARNNSLTEVANQLKIVRDARYTTPSSLSSYANVTEAWKDILEERRLELWVEGHRYVDIKRLGQFANEGYTRNSIDCSLYAAPDCNLPSTDIRTQYLPIPLNEINGNPGITQNEGY